MGILETLFGYVMKGCYLLTHNYVISLLLFALIFQILLFPLGLKQQKNMVKQASLRPQELAIRKKYAGRNDQKTMQKMQNELMELYQKNGYNQFAGCLPMLVQIIIIFPLYNVVIRPLQYCAGLSQSTCYSLATSLGIEFGKNGKPTLSTYQVNIAERLANGWRPAADLVNSNDENVLNQVNEMVSKFGGDVPNATIFGVDLGIDPFSALKTAGWLLILVPVINLALMYLSQYFSKKFNYQSVQQETQQGASSLKLMMYVLPLMTFFVTAKFAAAIGIYWIFRTILSMVQQYVLYKIMPYPQFSEEEYRQAEKDYKKGNTSPSGSRVIPDREYRSLHHIDDDDE